MKKDVVNKVYCQWGGSMYTTTHTTVDSFIEKRPCETQVTHDTDKWVWFIKEAGKLHTCLQINSS